MSCEIGQAEVRRLVVGGVEVVQRVYFAVRNVDWHVVPVAWEEVSKPAVETTKAWLGRLAWHEIEMEVTVQVRLSRDGLDFSATASAITDFDYSRLGIFVILPIRPLQGRRVDGRGEGGTSWSGHFPVTAGPQRLNQGHPQALFPPHRFLAIELEYGDLRLDFEGDTFEVEDERNWTENGYKVYAGPFSRGWPLRLRGGAVVRQSLRVSYENRRNSSRPVTRSDVAAIVVDKRRCLALPMIGHRLAELSRPMSIHELESIRALAPAFLTLDVHDTSVGGKGLSRALDDLVRLKCELAVNLFVHREPERAGARLAQALAGAGRSPLAVFLYDPAPPPPGWEPAGTPPGLRDRAAAAVREAFPLAWIFTGSANNLAEVNRTPPFRGQADGLSIGMSPSGHNDDTWAIFENLPAQGDAVRTLTAFDPGGLVAANPITLQIQSGGGPRPPDAHPWPPSVDARQPGKVAASWTLGSIAELAGAGAHIAVYYETVGWRGLMERDDGPIAGYPSLPGQLFSVYGLFRDMADLRSWRLQQILRGDQRVACLCFSSGDRRTLLISNLSASVTTVRVSEDDSAGRRVLLEEPLQPHEYRRFETLGSVAPLLDTGRARR